MSEKMIPASAIEDLIEFYWGYEHQCVTSDLEGSGDKAIKARAKASLYRTVIGDLEALLPRKTMADIPQHEWTTYKGTWVEVDDEKLIVFRINFGREAPFDLLDVVRGVTVQATPDVMFPLDVERAW